MEIVHVELTDEGGEVVMFEVLGQDQAAKILWLQNNKGVTLG